MKCDVLIVGAGPVGSFTAEKIAGCGFTVLLAEENDKVGEPVQCAGLISPRAMELTGLGNDIVLNKLRGLRVFSPLGASLQTESSRVFSLAIDRAELDRRLALKAEKAGAILHTNTKVTGLQPNANGYRAAVIKDGRTFSIQARLVIGADGTHSKVSKWLNLKNNNPKAVMYAADVEMQRDNTETIDVFFGRALAPGWFGWLIPLNKNTCRVGTGYAFIMPNHPPQYYFQQMVDAFPNVFNGFKVIRCTGGTVPLGPMPKIFASHAMLAGDAACQTKPISGGGIYTGLRAAEICAATAVEALNEDDLSELRLARYQKLWNKEMGNEISSSMSYRESFLHFDDKDIDLLVSLLNRPKWLKTILQYGDIDYPSFLASKLFLLHPLIRTFFQKICCITSGPFHPINYTNNGERTTDC